MGSTRTVRIYEEDIPRIDQHSQLPEEASVGATVNDVLNRLEESSSHGGRGLAGMNLLPSMTGLCPPARATSNRPPSSPAS